MFHMLAYQKLEAQGATNEDMTAVNDSVFTTRNSHFIFSEKYKVLAAFTNGGDWTDMRFNVPSMNVLGRHHIWPGERSTTIPDQPAIADYRDYPLDLPVREEIALEGSNNDGAATDQNQVFLWLGSQDWTRQLPRGQARITIAVTGAVAGVAASWSGLGNVTFAENLKGGYYALVGAQCFDAGTLAVRFYFPHSMLNGGKVMRPGILATEAIGNTPLPENMGGFGVLGVFDTDEPPQIEIFANATAASAQVMRWDLVYLGGSPPTMYN